MFRPGVFLSLALVFLGLACNSGSSKSNNQINNVNNDIIDNDISDSDIINTNNLNNTNNTNNQNPVYVGTQDVFGPGSLTVQFREIAQDEAGAPVLVRVWYPQEPGTYAVILFQHGFLMSSGWYSTLLAHLASHGFVVAAPQMYAADGLPLGKPTAAEEAVTAVEVHAWVTTQLGTLLGQTVPYVQRLGYAGHSRGGKVAWLVLSGDPTLAQAVAGVDPVDGTGGPLGGEERVVDGPFGFPFPTYVLGTGLGPQSSGFNSACAPEGDNSVQFYGASAAPAWHVIATEYGHNDMLDADASCGMTCSVCAAGPTPALFLQMVSGHLTAFFRGTLQQDATALPILSNTAASPVEITVESR